MIYNTARLYYKFSAKFVKKVKLFCHIVLCTVTRCDRFRFCHDQSGYDRFTDHADKSADNWYWPIYGIGKSQKSQYRIGN